MGRWAPDALERLQVAALELFGEHGYDHVTVAEITGRAGLTERTFYRYFADKREVLFGPDRFTPVFVSGAVDAPVGAEVTEVVASALDRVAELFPAERRGYAGRRQQTIDATASLQERELLKLASLTTALAGAFRSRGVADPQASLAAEMTVSVFRVSFATWLTPGETRDLARVQRDTLASLRTLTSSVVS